MNHQCPICCQLVYIYIKFKKIDIFLKCLGYMFLTSKSLPEKAGTILLFFMANVLEHAKQYW